MSKINNNNKYIIAVCLCQDVSPYDIMTHIGVSKWGKQDAQAKG